MNVSNLEKRIVVVYGLGKFWESKKDLIKQKIRIDYLCDQKIETECEIDGIRAIQKNKLKKLITPVIFVCIEDKKVNREIVNAFLEEGFCVYEIQQLLQGYKTIEKDDYYWDDRKKRFKYSDVDGNEIVICDSQFPNFTVRIYGSDSKLLIGNNVELRGIIIGLGSNAEVNIGNHVVINYTWDIVAADGKIQIGDNCILGANVTLRTCNGHHIFDLDTKQRICRPKDVIIGNHVWIGKEAVLFGGARIGDGSIVGARSLTSSTFGSNVMIVGAPARVTRDRVVWSRDAEIFFSRNSLGECEDLAGLVLTRENEGV